MIDCCIERNSGFGRWSDIGLLVLVRHGQAAFGHDSDPSLTDLGVAQAQLAGERLGRWVPRDAAVLAGALARQRQTATQLMISAGLAPENLRTESRLNEYDAERLVKIVEAGDSLDIPHDRSTYQPRLDRALSAWTRGEHLEGNEETWVMFRARIESVLADLTHKSGVTIAVSSGGVIAGMCAQLWGVDSGVWQGMSRVVVNGGVSKVVTGRSGQNVVSFNDHAHLEGQASNITYR